jgi:hypothetical protein
LINTITTAQNTTAQKISAKNNLNLVLKLSQFDSGWLALNQLQSSSTWLIFKIQIYFKLFWACSLLTYSKNL